MPNESIAVGWLPLLQTIFTGLGLISLGLLWYQLRLSTRWNKLQGQANFLNRSLDEQEGKLQGAFQPIGIDFFKQIEPLTEAQSLAIWQDSNAFLEAKTYLNAFEDIGAAVRIGFVDADFAFALESARLLKAWRIFSPLIRHIRDYHSDHAIYNELENVANDWESRLTEEAAQLSQGTKAARAKIGLSRRKF